jgi:hypothetical protein
MTKKGSTSRISDREVTEIRVAGFKSINSECTLNLRPLTLLAGANSSGKSSLLQPVLLLKQTLDASFDPGQILLDGPNVRLTSNEQIRPRFGSGRATETLSITFASERRKLALRLRSPGRGLEVYENVIVVGDEELVIARDSPSRHLYKVLKMLSTDEGEFFRQFENKLQVQAERFFFNIRGSLGTVGGGLSVPLTGVTLEVDKLLSRWIHVPGLRGNPARTYRTTAVGPKFPGTFESYVASIIHEWQINKSDNLRVLGQYLERLGLTWKVTARAYDDTQVELMVGRLPHPRQGGARDLVSIADVGFGVSQTLPVLVALLVAEPGQVVYVEQPEIHLHPTAQYAMASVLAETAKRGVKVIVETHSSILLLAVQTLVAQEDIDWRAVSLHWVKRNDIGETEVAIGELDRSGGFGEWPVDFWDVSLLAERKYLEAAERQLTLKLDKQ